MHYGSVHGLQGLRRDWFIFEMDDACDSAHGWLSFPELWMKECARPLSSRETAA
jgi:hypothetical protein